MEGRRRDEEKEGKNRKASEERKRGDEGEWKEEDLQGGRAFSASYLTI